MTTIRWRAAIAALVTLVGGADASAQALPATYDLRAVASGTSTVAWVPAIQDQGIFNDCWTFASATAIESNLLQNGFFGPAPTAPPAQISSWHLSTRNGAAESLVRRGSFGNNSTNYGWGGFEYQTMGYLTRGQGAWAIPDLPATNPGNYISTMGGGPVLVSGTVNAFPAVLVNTAPASIADLLPVADQPPAFQTRGVTFLQQGFSNNVALPPSHGSVTIGGGGYSKYRFDQGAADPQVQSVKQAILSSGAVTTSMNADYSFFHYVANSGTASVPYTVQYVNPTEATGYTDHEVTIIGWNDTATITSTSSGTTYTGAWIVQNSWGTNYWTDSNVAYANDGTFLAPYDDPAIGRTGVASFTMGPAGTAPNVVLQNELGPIGYAYDFNATSDVLGMAADEHATVASVLTPATDGSLVAIGVATSATTSSLVIDVYSDWSGGPTGALLTSTTVTLGSIGYQLVDLAAPVPLNANDGVTVLLTYGTSGAAPIVVGGDGLYGVTTGSDGRPSYPVASGLSYYLSNSGTWVDFATKTYTATPGYGSADTLGGVLFLKGVMVASVPEPGTLAIATVGLGVALWAGLRRRHAARRSRASFLSLIIEAGSLLGGREALAQAGYTSPFSIALAPDIAAWTSDFAARRQLINQNATPAQADWYTTTYTDPYGPLNPQLYSTGSIGSPDVAASLQFDRGSPVYGAPLLPPPSGVSVVTWQQQRILAAANVLLTATNGTAYQHLHLPDFDPAQVTTGTFPWISVSVNPTLQSSWQLANGVAGTASNPYAGAYGQPTPGIDCTDFSAYVYNLALGVQMHSGTPNQVQFSGSSGKPAPGATASAIILDTTGTPLEPQFFYGPNFGTDALNTGTGAGPLASLISQFQPGDLLYMGDPNLGILHVVMWLGQTGTDSSGNTFPLVISSHDNTPAIFDTLALDASGFPLDGNNAGHLPPPGVHILPFDQSNWFYQDFQLAMRVLAVPEPSIYAMALAGLACGGFSMFRRRKRA